MRRSNADGVWNLRAIPNTARRATESSVISRPLNHMRPAVGVRWPDIMLMKVVLPAPFGPITQRTSPVSSAKSTLSLATRPRNRLVRPSVRSSSITAALPRLAAERACDRAR